MCDIFFKCLIVSLFLKISMSCLEPTALGFGSPVICAKEKTHDLHYYKRPNRNLVQVGRHEVIKIGLVN